MDTVRSVTQSMLIYFLVEVSKRAYRELAAFSIGSFLPASQACHACDDFDKKYVAYEYRIRLCVEEESDNPAPAGQEHRLSMVVDLAGKDAVRLLFASLIV